MDNKVWVTVIYVNDVPNNEVFINWTRQGALDALAAYCREYWQDVSDDPAPENDGELIRQYFNSHADGEEWYSITIAEVGL